MPFIFIVGQSVVDACCTAYKMIDLNEHEGGHPRLGAVDLIPIHPMSPDVTLADCGIIAKGIIAGIIKRGTVNCDK